MYEIPVTPPKEVIDAYAKWINELLEDNDYEGFLVTVFFDPIPGSPETVIRVMHRETASFFSRLITRVVNKPQHRKGKKHKPVAMFFVDVPDGLNIMDMRDVLVSGGDHLHGVILVRKKSKLKESLNIHIEYNKDVYVKDRINRIHVKPIKSNHYRVTTYSGKGIRKRQFGYDDILILPH